MVGAAAPTGDGPRGPALALGAPWGSHAGAPHRVRQCRQLVYRAQPRPATRDRHSNRDRRRHPKSGSQEGLWTAVVGPVVGVRIASLAVRWLASLLFGVK